MNSYFSKSFKALIVTQALSALNDSLFKLLVSLLVVSRVMQGEGGIVELVLINVFFVLPFILGATFFGIVSDKFSKTYVLRIAKFLELVVVSVAYLFLEQKNVPVLLLMLFVMGIHSALFSPAKYGILPELVEETQLSRANGLLEMWSFMAVIAGTALGGFLTASAGSSLSLPGIVMIFLALVGLWASFFITYTVPRSSEKVILYNPLRSISVIKELKQDRGLFLALVGVAYFWAVGQFFHLDILLYSKQMAGLGDFGTSMFLMILGIGVGLGSFTAGVVSGGKVELGLVPLGALGIATTSVLLSISYTHPFFSSLLLFGLGISSGFFIIPLNSYYQRNSPAEMRGAAIASSNFVSYLGILFASFLLLFLVQVLGLNSAQVLLIIGVSALGVGVYVCRLMPEMLIRCLNWILSHSLYKVRVQGLENLPKEGGALIVCNHVAYVDPPLILATTDRPVRFLMYRKIYEMPLIHPVAKRLGAIPIAPDDNPKELIRSLNAAGEALKNGEIVCIFAEGSLTRIGHLLRFERGFERVMKGVSVPIIPAYIDQIWGSIFSFKDGRFFWKFPEQLPYPVKVAFGKPLPATAKAFEVRQVVLELAADLAQGRKEKYSSLPSAFIHTCRRHMFRLAATDITGKKQRFANLLISSLALSKKFKNLCSGQQMVGVLLPSSVAGMLSNVSLMLAGKVPVNLNFTASKASIESAIAQCKIETIISSRRFVEKLGIDLAGIQYLEDLQSEIGRKDKVRALLLALICPQQLLERLVLRLKAKREDLATVIFSSGSTGEPKGVMLSHGNIASNIESLYQVFQIKRDDCVLGVLPFFHSFGFTATLWLPLLAGIKVVYHHDPTEAGAVGELIQKERGTILMSTPTFLLLYIRKCTAEQFRSLRHVVVGAEKLKDRVATAFFEKFAIPAMEGYGCTELSPVAILNVPDYEDSNVSQKGHKPGTVGHPLPGVAVRIVDPDNFTILPPQTEGLLMVKGPNVMMGYLGNPEKTAEVVRDGWYITGDIATLDDDGFVTITDRISRFSKIGGEMVPHLKIEEEINRVLGEVEPVCVVTAVADEKKGEKLVVLTTKQVDPSEIIKHLSESGLPNLWIPKKENYHLVESFPILGSGKLDLKRIKSIATELSGL